MRQMFHNTIDIERTVLDANEQIKQNLIQVANKP